MGCVYEMATRRGSHNISAGRSFGKNEKSGKLVWVDT